MSKDPHRIALEDAVRMVRRARQAKLLSVNGWQVGGEIIREILAQPGAAGLRVYLAEDEGGGPTLVFLAVDGEGRDMYQGTIAEYAKPCPPDCDEHSPFIGN